MSLKVAYVYDELGMCQMFFDNFASNEVDIKTYTDPQKFLDEAESLDLDLVILDYRFPNANGDEIAKALGSKVQKVLVSGDLTINPDQTYVKTFTKPFNFDEVQAFLDGLAAQKHAAVYLRY